MVEVNGVVGVVEAVEVFENHCLSDSPRQACGCMHRKAVGRQKGGEVGIVVGVVGVVEMVGVVMVVGVLWCLRLAVCRDVPPFRLRAVRTILHQDSKEAVRWGLKVHRVVEVIEVVEVVGVVGVV